MYRPSELIHFLESIGVKPKKSLSQNFLIDGNIIRKLVELTDDCPSHLTLEIGSGPGALTEELLHRGREVVAVEMDHHFARALERLNKTGNLHIFNQDILQFDFEAHFDSFLKPGQKGIVCANLPFHITTPILTKLVTMRERFERLIVIVHDEVAYRFTGKDISSITLFLDYYSTVKFAFKIPKNCFYPVPKVESAVVVLDLHEPLLQKNEEKFFKMVREAYFHRRKMLRASLKDLYLPSAIENVLLSMGYPKEARPEILSLEAFLEFFQRLE